MMNSENYLSQKENAKVERFKRVLSDILLEAAAISANPNHTSDKLITQRFEFLIEESKNAAGNPFADYAAIFELLKDLKIGDQLLINLNLEESLKHDQTRALLTVRLKELYSQLRNLSSTLSAGPSSFLFIG